LKYILQFEKKGLMAYISHLDLQRVFLRVLRMTDHRPAYSHGFNPHPKLSIALPLSLGFTSDCEYLEVQSEKPWLTKDKDGDFVPVLKILNARLPKGIAFTAIYEKNAEQTKTLSALCIAAEYEMTVPNVTIREADLVQYLSREEILAEKRIKKTGKMELRNIRPLVYAFAVESLPDGSGVFRCKLAAGAQTISPLILLSAFFAESGMPLDVSEVSVKRTKIIFP
jgi:radical SAM-linked protein